MPDPARRPVPLGRAIFCDLDERLDAEQESAYSYGGTEVVRPKM
jgi:hypothetical protein